MGADNKSLLDRRLKAIPRGIGTMAFDRFIQRADNDLVYDVDGNKYIDFTAGIAVNNLGHANKAIGDAVKEQIDKYTHSAFQVMGYESYIEVCENLNDIVPINAEKKSILFNSGAEAVENAIKIAKAYTQREAVISFVGAFHGRTNLTMGLTGKVVPYQESFGLPYPYTYHIPYPIDFHNVSVADSKRALEYLFKATIAPSNVACIIIEPTLGEGGFYDMPDELAEYLRAICDEHNIVLIFDEIQTGFGRTGKMFATEHYQVSPDMITMAKGIANGYVLSAITGRQEIMDTPNVGALGGTYTGSPIACSASLAVMKFIKDNGILEQTATYGEMIRERLSKIKSSALKNVRGRGCMNAFELVDEEGNPSGEKAKKVVSDCLQKGLLILSCGTYGNTIRILNALTIERDNLEKGLDILQEVVEGL